jgi:hypothetical protein
MEALVFVCILLLGATFSGLRGDRPSGRVGPLLLLTLVLAGAWYAYA